jgi:hypothetical protein
MKSLGVKVRREFGARVFEKREDTYTCKPSTNICASLEPQAVSQKKYRMNSIRKI